VVSKTNSSFFKFSYFFTEKPSGKYFLISSLFDSIHLANFLGGIGNYLQIGALMNCFAKWLPVASSILTKAY
jgi:hypothetical protein